MASHLSLIPEDALRQFLSFVRDQYRLSNVLAAIGRGLLRALDERMRRKREIYATYADTIGDLPGISLMPEAP